MMNCPKCRCTGRVKQMVEDDEGQKAVYICPNPRCKNYREVFGEEEIPAAQKTPPDEQ